MEKKNEPIVREVNVMSLFGALNKQYEKAVRGEKTEAVKLSDHFKPLDGEKGEKQK